MRNVLLELSLNVATAFNSLSRCYSTMEYLDISVNCRRSTYGTERYCGHSASGERSNIAQLPVIFLLVSVLEPIFSNFGYEHLGGLYMAGSSHSYITVSKRAFSKRRDPLRWGWSKDITFSALLQSHPWVNIPWEATWHYIAEIPTCVSMKHGYFDSYLHKTARREESPACHHCDLSPHPLGIRYMGRKWVNCYAVMSM